MKVYKNGFSFEIVRYYSDIVVIEVKQGGVIHHSYIYEKTTNISNGLDDYIDNNY